MERRNLEILYPKDITLNGGRKLHIREEDISNEKFFSLLVPSARIDDIAISLKREGGFRDAIPSFPKKEDYSISKIIQEPWELHIRLYHSSEMPYFGKIHAHFEISRQYFQHLSIVQPAIYEPFKFYEKIYDKFLLWCNPEKNWVSSIDGNYRIALQKTGSLTPWKPVITAAIAAGAFAGISYAISKLSRPK
ncbi:MAG: hypothetical protein QXZ44_03035 [Ferroplasma sp.]